MYTIVPYICTIAVSFCVTILVLQHLILHSRVWLAFLKYRAPLQIPPVFFFFPSHLSLAILSVLACLLCHAPPPSPCSLLWVIWISCCSSNKLLPLSGTLHLLLLLTSPQYSRYSHYPHLLRSHFLRKAFSNDSIYCIMSLWAIHSLSKVLFIV